jgi:hypothetical protein
MPTVGRRRRGKEEHSILIARVKTLRDGGMSWSDIAREVGCNTSYVCRLYDTNRHQRLTERRYQYRENNILAHKIRDFLRRAGPKRTISKAEVAAFERALREKVGPVPRSYLSGKPINLERGGDYRLDHVIPVAKGGPCTLENCNICTKAENAIKSYLLLNELCEEITSIQQYYFGLVVLRKDASTLEQYIAIIEQSGYIVTKATPEQTAPIQ